MSEFMPIIESLQLIGQGLIQLFYGALLLAADHALRIAWLAWWLFGVNWQRTWNYLAQGAWAPVVLLMLVAALVWSRVSPGNFWGQVGMISLVVGLTLFCGWLQLQFRWTPP